MKAQIRHILSIDVPDLPSWLPSSTAFAIDIRMIVGPADGPGEESFDITLCNPEWLKDRANDDGVVDLRHHLVVNDFDWERLTHYLHRRVEACQGTSWREVADCVARFAYWEFEDYRE
jgi:hypothetical protein